MTSPNSHGEIRQPRSEFDQRLDGVALALQGSEDGATYVRPQENPNGEYIFHELKFTTEDLESPDDIRLFTVELFGTPAERKINNGDQILINSTVYIVDSIDIASKSVSLFNPATGQYSQRTVYQLLRALV